MYELALELKKAGFPQLEEGDYVSIPSLEQLIEACGEKLNGLINKGGVWIATGGEHRGFYGDDFVPVGKTPTEAVARLWLALNKKHE